MRKIRQFFHNSAAGKSVWLFFWALLLLSLSACGADPQPARVVPAQPSQNTIPVPSSNTIPSPLSNATSASSQSATIPLQPITAPSSSFPPSGKANFSMSSSNPSLPEDILREVSFFPTGGDGDFCSKGNYPQPAWVEQPGASYELMAQVKLASCGWQNGESVILTVTAPNGTIYERGSIKTVSGATYHGFSPSLTDPTGAYTFVIAGSKGQIQTSITFKKPSGPRAYHRDSGIFLYQFSSNEKVRIFAYEDLPNTSTALNRTRLKGWQSYQVDNSGQLLIETKDSYRYVVIGETSGEIPAILTVTSRIDKITTSNKSSCAGAPPTRITSGKKARVTITGGGTLRVRQTPGIQGKEITKLKEGTTVDIIEGPTCADSFNWWKIKTSDGVTGWSAEGDSRVYNLEPWN